MKQIYVDLYSQTFTAYQTLPIVKVAFLDDNSAFISHILLCFDKRCSNFNRVWSVNFRCDIFFYLVVVYWEKNFKRDTKRSNTGCLKERLHGHSYPFIWSPRKRTTSVIVTGNFKFCLRRNLSSNLRSHIDRNAKINWGIFHGPVRGFVCFVPRLRECMGNHSYD